MIQIQEIEVVRHDGKLFFKYDGLLFNVLLASLFDGIRDKSLVQIRSKDGSIESKLRMFYDGTHIGELRFRYRSLKSTDCLAAIMFEEGDVLSFQLSDSDVHTHLKMRIIALFVDDFVMSQIQDKAAFNRLSTEKQQEWLQPFRMAVLEKLKKNPTVPLIYRN